MELKAQISSITNKAKESEQAEVESGDNQGPTVTEADIANIVAQWTGGLLSGVMNIPTYCTAADILHCS